jgi:hypothetical protein
MNLGQMVGVASQIFLMAFWFMAVVLAARFHLRLMAQGAQASRPDPVVETSRIRRSFTVFCLAFMPALAVWLPIFGRISPADQLFVPAILAWLILLVFGTLQFCLNLAPSNTALMAVMGMEGGESMRKTTAARTASPEEPRRNV